MPWCSAKTLPSLYPSFTCCFSRNLLSWENRTGQRSELRLREGLGRVGSDRPLDPKHEEAEEGATGCSKEGSGLQAPGVISLWRGLSLSVWAASCFYLCSLRGTTIGELRDEERGTEQHMEGNPSCSSN